MSNTASVLSASEDVGLVDCDVHPTFRRGLRDLAPYLSDGWRSRFGLRGDGPEADMFGGARDATIELPRSLFYFPTPGAFRKDALPPNGGIPASDPQFLIKHHLEPHGIGRAILLGQNVLTLGAYPHPDVACAVASAYNDWLDATWLQADARFRGAIVVAPQDPRRAAAEIRRTASRSDSWVSVLLPLNSVMMGDVYFHPIYEVAESLDLPVAVHISGVEGNFPGAPSLPGGTPATYLEFKTTYTTVYQANLVSLIVGGIFERFPTLRVAFTECGTGWLPEILWRMDTNWKALRDEAPWVKRLPSEYVFDRVRFTSQPFVEPPTNKQLRDFCEMIRVEKTLMFASDYPHYDFDDPTRTLSLLPREARAAVASETALSFFGSRLRNSAETTLAVGASR